MKSAPAWSPDGQAIVFARRGDLYTIRVRDGHVRRLTDIPDAREGLPAWRPAP